MMLRSYPHIIAESGPRQVSFLALNQNQREPIFMLCAQKTQARNLIIIMSFSHFFSSSDSFRFSIHTTLGTKISYQVSGRQRPQKNPLVENPNHEEWTASHLIL